MIRFSAFGAYLLLVPQGKTLIRCRALIRDSAHIHFSKKAECAKQSFDVYLKRTKKTWKRTCCPWILLGGNDQPSKRRKILRRDDSLERTLHSCGYNSWETETKTTVFVIKLSVSNQRNMNHDRSQRTCTLTALSPKQNRVPNWNSGRQIESLRHYSFHTFSILCSL